MTSGWVGKTEVVKIAFDKNRLSYKDLCRAAKSQECATVALPLNDEQRSVAKEVYGNAIESTDGRIRKVEDTRYYLKQTNLRFVPALPLQAVRLNSLKDIKGSARKSGILSPTQLKWLDHIEANPEKEWVEVCDMSLSEGLKAFERVRGK